MRNRSPAKSAASSPPVPARISRMAFFSSAESLGSSRIWISWPSSSMRSSTPGRVGFGQIAHFAVGRPVGKHRLKVGQFSLRLEQLPDLARQVLQVGIFRGQLDIGLGIGPGSHLRLEHVETLDELVHPVAGQADHDLTLQGNGAVVGEGLQQGAHRQLRRHAGKVFARRRSPARRHRVRSASP